MYKVKLQIFEGPLDLLLYLIRKNELDIYNIPIAEITDQYIEYINLMQSLDLDVAGEFILMAATLLHIKSETMLPSGSVDDNDEVMLTREELVRQLLEYKKFKEAASILSYKEEVKRNLYSRSFTDPAIEGFELREYRISASLFDLLSAFHKVLNSISEEQIAEFDEDIFTVEQKIGEILQILETRKRIEFSSLFKDICSRLEIIVTFLAILELTKSKFIVPRQSRLFGKIWLYRLNKPKAVEAA